MIGKIKRPFSITDAREKYILMDTDMGYDTIFRRTRKLGETAFGNIPMNEAKKKVIVDSFVHSHLKSISKLSPLRSSALEHMKILDSSEIPDDDSGIDVARHFVIVSNTIQNKKTNSVIFKGSSYVYVDTRSITDIKRLTELLYDVCYNIRQLWETDGNNKNQRIPLAVPYGVFCRKNVNGNRKFQWGDVKNSLNVTSEIFNIDTVLYDHRREK